MYRKKLVKGCLIGALAIAMSVTSLSPVMSGGAAVVQAAESQNTINVVFVDENGNSVGGGDYFISEIDKDGDGMFKESELTLPEGYELNGGGDHFTSEGSIKVPVKEIEKSATINIVFVDENGNSVGGGDYFISEIDKDGDGMFKESELTLPEGYELNGGGDHFTNEGSIKVPVKKIQKASIVKVQFVDENGSSIGGGDYFVDEDGDGVFNLNELTLPEGYELTTTGDAFVADGINGKIITVKVEKIQKASIVNVVYVDVNGNNVGGGDYFVDEDGDGVFNLNELVLPEGYELTTTGDAFVADGINGKTITVNVKLTMAIVNVQFVDEAGNVIGGGDCFVDRDGDGIFNYNELASAVPAGYKMTVGGDAFVKDAPFKITVEKINKGTVINVSFTDPQGNSLGGGDYLVDLDGDGIANYSELDLPVGYKLNVTGDFFVKEGEHYDIVLNRVGAAIIHVVFKSEGGKNLGGGDYFVDEDGDGIANYSELTLPEGYELKETGDFFVDTTKTYEITLNKEIDGTIINVVYVDEDGNNLGGGDYFVDMDDDGIANYSELDLPEGYELIVTGDFFVTAGQSYTIELKKIPEGKMINVVFVDEEGNNLGGGDYIVDEDGDGVANYSELDLPVGYELIVTGDFFVEDGGKYTITLRLRETVMTVTFEDTEGNVVGQEVLKAGVPGSPDDVYVFTLGEDFQLPEGYQLAEGVDQITDIEIPYGSVGGHTMIVEKIQSENPDEPGTPDDPDTPVTPDDPTTPENPGTTDDNQNTDNNQNADDQSKDNVKADTTKANKQDEADKDKAPQTGDTASPVIPVAAGGLSLAAIIGVLARKRMK